jgi:hypothetical protein
MLSQQGYSLKQSGWVIPWFSVDKFHHLATNPQQIPVYQKVQQDRKWFPDCETRQAVFAEFEGQY